ncbi:MAG TPA: tetratricopeptide repeat protein [Thermoanaerobaculia bacterium]|jgi:tetratricopeptide (TPR) repeat protein
MSELLQEFQSLLSRLPSSGAGGAEVLLTVMEPDKAEQLRLCAIPHEFSPEVLQVLVPGTAREQAEARCREFSELSAVSVADGELSLHRTVRSEIFSQWLQPDRYARFTEVSERLARYFETDSFPPAEERLHRFMFHRLGADLPRGFAEFEKLCRAARRESRWSACASLIALVHEYDVILSPELAAWLTYHEGKLASDLRDFEQAENLFGNLIKNPTISPELRAKALLRQGFIFCARRDFERSIELYRTALQIVESFGKTGLKPYEVLSSIGEAYRDSGELLEAEGLLTQSLAGAEAAGDLSAIANAHNALGALYLRRREGGVAAVQFEKSLACLEQLGDRFRVPQVYNNLGMVQAELGNWGEADRYYQLSLEGKRQAGDTRGQATTLLNRVRVLRRRNDLAQAIDSGLQARALFAEIRDAYGQAEAERTLGKTYLAMDDREAAREAFNRAAALFESCHAGEKASEVQKELEQLGRKVGLPWWAWLSLVLGLGLVLLFLLIFIIAVLEN